jgi:hypothetical protein
MIFAMAGKSDTLKRKARRFKDRNLGQEINLLLFFAKFSYDSGVSGRPWSG